MNDHAVVLKPLITEKTNVARYSGNKFYFQVHPKANKNMITSALEKIYKVKVVKCNVLIVKGKKKRTRYGASYGSNWKKAIVTLKTGDKFDFYEGI